VARVKLTAKRVESLTTEKAQQDFWDSLTAGLCLRVSGATGRKTWMVRYRPDGAGKYRRQKLGTYPNLSLADARSRARDILGKVEDGEDPAAEKEAKAAPPAPVDTFATLAREVLDARARKGKGGKPTRRSTQRERTRILERELLPAWGDRPAGSITRREVVLLVEGVAKRAPVQGNRTLAVIRLIFNDGLRRGFPGLETSPAHMVEAPGVEEGRDRYLGLEELPHVWAAMGEENPLTLGAYRLALLTAQRIGSVAAMRWDRIEGDVWTIPEEDFKGKRDHLVPLSEEAQRILADLREVATSETWVFPARAGTKRPHLTNLSRALGKIRDRSGLEHWTAHDFRTTFRTHATRAREDGGLGVAGHVADAVLGHAENSLGYTRYTGDRHRYLLHEKREALQKWGALVRGAVGVDG